MEVALGALVVIAWIAVVIWGTAILIVEAKRKNDWAKVGIAVLSAMTVAGPLLTLMPEQVFFGIHTIGLGFVLAFVSGFVIFVVALNRTQRR
ncbi:hypothetical protein [Bradyrhizobium sp. Leo170]|uniref:hypothetical protein n=1 Tax=Bradyrhizobium sp. Leo170 TaxID=1571199 RepID=UPI00102E84B7|nr:hypothetical protein [Bradyrhizobium sp. Leo170]TAI65703.1 hypothetical protein CWO89_12235 [Bradyrhizobium sp. Leo170]